MIYIKSEKEIELMRESARILKEVLKAIEANIKEGVTTSYLDYIADKTMKLNSAKASFKGVPCFDRKGGVYKHSTCISVNDEIIHGIPGDRILKEGDLVSVDLGVYKNGYHSDAGRTYGVGKISDTAKKLISVTEGAFFEGIAFAKEGFRIGDISNAIQTYVEKAGFNLVREFQGHGIGKEMHEDPGVPNIRGNSKGERICKGMALAIEPMVTEGKADITVAKDYWTIKTRDGKLSSYYENTIIITESEPEVLTL